MRTTLTIDDDVLEDAKAQADHEGKSVGKVISEVFRAARTRDANVEKPRYRNGIRLLTVRGGGPITLDMVNALRDDER